MTGRVMLACARTGLETVLLGAYDGAGSWSITVNSLRSSDEQLMVETHEGLHHELQASTSYGLVASVAAQLAGRGVRRYALREVFQEMVDNSRQVHEVFATTLSAYTTGVDRTRQLLADNSEYTAHLATGLSLGGAGVPERFHGTIAASVLRCCMAPAAMESVIAGGFATLRRDALADPGDAPDVRLARLRALQSSGGWNRLFAGRTEPDDDMIRDCYEHARSILDRAGLASVRWTEQADVAMALRASVAEIDPELADRLNIVTERRPVLDDGLEYDRQKVVLRERLPARVVALDEDTGLDPAFVIRLPDGRGQCVCAVWLARPVAAKQFVLPIHPPLPHLVVALLGVDDDPPGRPVVQLGLLQPELTPRDVQNRLGAVPLIVLTSHLTLFDPAVDRRLRRVHPVFVLMDLPVAWQVKDWIQQGASVRMALVPLDGLTNVELWMAAFTVDRRPGLRFLSIGGKVGVSVLAERLRRRHGDRLTIDGEFLRQDAAAVNAALTTVFDVWHVLDQDAAE